MTTPTLVDLVKIVCDSTGTGAITLGQAVPGYRGIEALTNGNIYSYSVQQNGNYEYGRGTYLSSGHVLTRAPLSSSSGGTAINLAQGAQIAIVLLAEDLSDIVRGQLALAFNDAIDGITSARTDAIADVDAEGMVQVGEVEAAGVAAASTAAAIISTLRDEPGVSVFESAGIPVVSYAAAYGLASDYHFTQFYAEVEATDPGTSIVVSVVVDNVVIHGPVTVTKGTPVTTVVDLDVAEGKDIRFAFSSNVGGVKSVTAKLVGSPVGGEGGGVALLDSPHFTGTPTAPTAATGTNTTQLATTAFVLAQIAALVASALGNDPNFATTIATALGGKQPLNSRLTALAAGTDLPVVDGGTGASDAATALSNLGIGTTDSPQFAGINVGHASDTTITRTGAGDIAVEGNQLYRAGGTDVAIADGGTGASTAALARANLAAAGITDIGFGGYPLIFPNGSIVPISRPLGENIASGTTDLYTVPTGRRAFVAQMLLVNATGSSVTMQFLYKIGGNYYPVNTPFVAGAGTSAASSTYGYFMEAGEKFSINTSAAGMSVWGLIVEFDNTSGWKSAKLTSLANGDNLMLTAGANGALFGSLSLAGSNAAHVISVYNGSGSTITALKAFALKSSDTASATSNQSSISLSLTNATSNASTLNIPAAIGAGEKIIVNASAAVSSGNSTWMWFNYYDL